MHFAVVFLRTGIQHNSSFSSCSLCDLLYKLWGNFRTNQKFIDVWLYIRQPYTEACPYFIHCTRI